MGCQNTSGAYVCNDQDTDISVPLAEVIQALQLIDGTCHQSDQGTASLDDNNALSGQAFVDNYGGYNAIVAYCNNNDPVNTAPSSYTAPGKSLLKT